jgi:hypothetical protein
MCSAGPSNHTDLSKSLFRLHFGVMRKRGIARLTRIQFGAGWAILISANLLAAILV